jgi:hypothetical protein
MSEPRGYLGRYQPRRIDVEAEKRAGWRDHRILVVRADDIRLTWPERELIEQLGAKLYGAKGKPGRRDG